MDRRWGKRFLWGALAVPVSGLGYFGTSILSGVPDSWRIGTTLDAAIPFWPVAIWGYVAYYPFPLTLFFLTPRFSDFLRALACLAAQSVLAYGVFLVFPVYIDRPTVHAVAWHQDIARWLIHLLYTQADPHPGNCFPSLHVSVSFTTALILQEHHPRWTVPALVAAALISTSTVLVKQHYVLDIPSGMALAFAAWWVFYRVPSVRDWKGFADRD